MEAKNVNGTVVGRTTDGRILIEVAPHQVLAGLALWGPVAAADPGPAPDARVPGKSTPAQRRFGHPKPDKPEPTKHVPRPCAICGGTFLPPRSDSKVCARPACRKSLRAQWQRTWLHKGDAPAVSPKVGLTPDQQKAARLDTIRALKARVYGDRPRRSTMAEPEIPAELAQAQREAGEVES